ncbi:sigma-70 family RNA polymerase sigma factor, partial [Actinoallomurus sp. NPDC052274]|uniref:RNA polymerase sigma factor n=1 Tax=Actinoallomurus sp. NPDC052274 TaxID=3155420 RepID=UPI003434DBA7
MEDRLLVSGLRSGDPGAIGAVYDTYADRLYDYCWFQLRNREAAQLTFRDTLLAAEVHIGELRVPERFGPWLYALARIECRRRRPPGVPHPDLPIARHDQDDVDLRVIAWRAVTGLPALSQELLDLHHRHSLETADLAGVVGLPVREVTDLLRQAGELLEAAVIAEILAHEDTLECDGRAAILRHRRGELGDDVRAALVGHGIECDVCAAHLPRTISTAKVCALLPHAVPPDSLRRQVTGCFTDPRLAGYRLFAAARLRAFGARGFPRQQGPGRADPAAHAARWPRGLVAATGAVVTAVGVATVCQWIGRETRHLPVVAGGGASRTHSRVPSPGVIGPPAVGRPVAATFALGPRDGAVAPTARPAPLVPAADNGWVYAEPGRLRLGSGGTGTVVLQAVDGAVQWHAAATGAVTVEPSDGSLGPGETGRTFVRAPGDGPGEAVITFSPGGMRVVVDWSAPAPPSAPPPGSPQPTPPPSSPTPSPAPPSSPPPTPAPPPSSPPSSPPAPPPSTEPPPGRPSDSPPATARSSQSGPPERHPAPQRQTGDRQTGDRQTGDRQTGDRQTGDRQTGDRQT